MESHATFRLYVIVYERRLDISAVSLTSDSHHVTHTQTLENT